jgi:hypothetical protein
MTWQLTLDRILSVYSPASVVWKSSQSICGVSIDAIGVSLSLWADGPASGIIETGGSVAFGFGNEFNGTSIRFSTGPPLVSIVTVWKVTTLLSSSSSPTTNLVRRRRFFAGRGGVRGVVMVGGSPTRGGNEAEDMRQGLGDPWVPR